MAIVAVPVRLAGCVALGSVDKFVGVASRVATVVALQDGKYTVDSDGLECLVVLDFECSVSDMERVGVLVKPEVRFKAANAVVKSVEHWRVAKIVVVGVE